MSQILSAAGSLVDRIKINAVSREYRDGRALWIKRRRWTARPVMACANRFFRLVGNPIQALEDPEAWQRWEVDCFLRLHGGEFSAFAKGRSVVVAEEVPGKSLSRYLSEDALTEAMVTAAARELRRAHEAGCQALRGAWSHGDPHAGNFIYEERTGRARLIDFEVMHNPAIGADARHADDLLIFLQDVVGRIAAAQWLPAAQAFLAAYERPEIVKILRENLVVPSGLPRVWWAVRTTYMGTRELKRRVGELRESL